MTGGLDTFMKFVAPSGEVINLHRCPKCSHTWGDHTHPEGGEGQLQPRMEMVLEWGVATPGRAHGTDAGIDLAVRYSDVWEATDSIRFRTGVRVEIPQGYWGLIHTRSSTRQKYGLNVRTAVIDAGYRGELLIGCRAERAGFIAGGIRIAQLILIPVPAIEAVVVDEFTGEAMARGINGFGSSG